jgi:polysaccharide export outer membrane protein
MLKKFVTAACLLMLALPGGGAAEEYLVGEGDILRISVYGHDDLTTEVRVSGEGTISFPLIEDVAVGGKTVAEIADVVTQGLADGFIIDPQVSVFVSEFRSMSVTIMGNVRNPGLYELHGQTTFLELLSKAGGLSDEAGDRATIKRKGSTPGTGGVIAVDLRRLVREGDTNLDVIIVDGDNIYVGEAELFYITGEVRKPASYRLEGATSVAKAITLAGGVTSKADREQVLLIRGDDNSEETVDSASGRAREVLIRRGDTIYVPEAGLFYVTGEVEKPGSFPWEQGTTVIKAAARAGGFTDKAAEGRTRIVRVVDGEETVLRDVDPDDAVLPGDVVIVPESFF